MFETTVIKNWKLNCFFFFLVSGKGLISEGGGLSNLTEITGIGGGFLRFCKKDQSTKKTNKGKVTWIIKANTRDAKKDIEPSFFF